jgi:DNA polymerase-3 subunit alpha
MERTVAHQIVNRRLQGGPFTSLEDFINRVDIGAEQLEILIRIGAFRLVGKKKYELMWEKNALMRSYCSTNNTGNLFEERVANWQLPVDALEEHPFDQHFDEIELLGFPLCSPFELLEPNAVPTQLSLTTAHQLKNQSGQFIYILGYYVCRKTIRTKKGQPMEFGTWIDTEGHFFDTTHFHLSNQKNKFTGKGIYLIKGKVTLDFDFPNIEVIAMKRLPIVKDQRF